ncbi:MAG: UDP-N-acetylmuramoyl-L-alanine--D-glutamate ligase [Gammaproteobacteria bacterium]|nr:UDP-N-acetylmuramoyl-L-alanine--D-glutamate ligase [Gammaproteobacteria bacterium]
MKSLSQSPLLTRANSVSAQIRPDRWVILGLGKTGLSVARFLSAQGEEVVVFDTRSEPPNLKVLSHELPGIKVHTTNFPEDLFRHAKAFVVSPGIALELPVFESARQAGIPIFGDIELFTRHVTAPYIAITGSNGKSTVTTLVSKMIEAAGYSVKAGANLGTPALDLLLPPEPAYYVLELSSFQLECTTGLSAEVACILNITADHLDRHKSIDAYVRAKARILHNADYVVLNADDPLVVEVGKNLHNVHWISTNVDTPKNYGVANHGGSRWLTHEGAPLWPISAIQIKGTHNEFNALAAIAITDRIGVPRAVQRAILEQFPGLDHRCRLVAEHNGVRWFNDSKGTNIGATVAAVGGIFSDRAGVLIAGGQGKGADFRGLRTALINRVHSVVLIGEDAKLIEAVIDDVVSVAYASDMREAVALAARAVRSGESVLLSPACASLDMFDNYEARGYAFEAAVRAMLQT